MCFENYLCTTRNINWVHITRFHMGCNKNSQWQRAASSVNGTLWLSLGTYYYSRISARSYLLVNGRTSTSLYTFVADIKASLMCVLVQPSSSLARRIKSQTQHDTNYANGIITKLPLQPRILLHRRKLLTLSRKEMDSYHFRIIAVIHIIFLMGNV